MHEVIDEEKRGDDSDDDSESIKMSPGDRGGSRSLSTTYLLGVLATGLKRIPR